MNNLMYRSVAVSLLVMKGNVAQELEFQYLSIFGQSLNRSHLKMEREGGSGAWVR